MRKYLVGLAVASTAIAVMATDARVETMGGQHHFFKDDQSIYTNPATIADFDKMLIGSFGIYTEDNNTSDSLMMNYPNYQFNRDATRPYFGATMSWGETEDSKSKFTIGTVFNRYDPLIGYVTRGSGMFIGDPKNASDSIVFAEDLVGKMDIIAGYTMDNGLTVGLGGYLAFQSNQENNEDLALTRVAKGTIGISGPVSNSTVLDASVGIAALSLEGYELNNSSVSAISANDDIAVTVDVRAFAAMPSINGDFVPHIQANIIKHHEDETLLDFNGGIGFNSYIDRGFLWGGFEGLYQNDSYVYLNEYYDINDADSTGERSRIGGRVSFGIERNVLTDWLVWRVGASKLLAYESLNDGNLSSYWVENSEDDHVSFGMGVNIENRFKVDAVVSENLLYTFSNLFTGNSHHFSSKISATFAF